MKLIYFPPLLDYERYTTASSYVIITNGVQVIRYYDSIEIDELKYIIANNYSNLNLALFSIVFDERLTSDILVQ
jgi:hypothetical protein